MDAESVFSPWLFYFLIFEINPTVPYLGIPEFLFFFLPQTGQIKNSSFFFAQKSEFLFLFVVVVGKSCSFSLFICGGHIFTLSKPLPITRPKMRLPKTTSTPMYTHAELSEQGRRDRKGKVWLEQQKKIGIGILRTRKTRQRNSPCQA